MDAHDAAGARDHCVVVNPLGGALAHYTAALVANLGARGVDSRVVAVDEPSVSGRPAWRWLLDSCRALRAAGVQARRIGARHVVVTWPVLGYLDLVLARVLLGPRVQGVVILHDPRPLVHARGYGLVAPRLARVLAGRHRIVAHSTRARVDIVQDFGVEPAVLPHPVAPERVDGRSARGAALPVVRVLGQYKRDRDLPLLAELAARVGHRARLEVLGRGWPPIDGWTVVEGFVSEDRLDELLRTSDCILIPYRRFYQSGIAVRCLEVGTPFVGPADSSLADLVGSDAPTLAAATDPVDAPGEWERALDVALSSGVGEQDDARAAADRAGAAWAELVRRQD